jgi:hypothetical protein
MQMLLRINIDTAWVAEVPGAVLDGYTGLLRSGSYCCVVALLHESAADSAMYFILPLVPQVVPKCGPPKQASLTM